VTARISARRLEHAAELEVDTLVSACPWSERPLSEAGDARSIDVVDIHELLAESLGIEVGGSRGGPR
jgi:heterodisulfide reductase subunit D